MENPSTSHAHNGIGVSLVDGEPGVRRARQIMLRSEHYDVRSYATCEALLADPRALDYPCIVVDVHMIEVEGVDLLRQMRASGWVGRGILLDGTTPGNALVLVVEKNGDRVFARTITDRALVAAIFASVERA